jgi:lipase chaperone LimK
MKIQKIHLGFGAVALATAFLTVFTFSSSEPDFVPPPMVVKQGEAFPFVRSMEGSKPDGDLKTRDDVLVVDEELGHLFDYYLNALGEKSLAAIEVELERELRRKLPAAAAAQARQLMGRYIEYRRALAEVDKLPVIQGTTASAVRGRLLAMQKVRAKFFSPKENEGLFGFSDAYDLDAVARLEISDDRTLSDAEKAKRFAAVDAARPPAVREAQEAPLKLTRIEAEAKKIRDAGGSEQEVYQMRARNLSADAAAGLAELDQEEAAWKAKFAAYRAEREKLLALPQQNRLAALQQFQKANFNQEDFRRLAMEEDSNAELKQ